MEILLLGRWLVKVYFQGGSDGRHDGGCACNDVFELT